MPAIIQQVKTGEMSPIHADCVFLWLYCLDGRPYAKYLPAGAPRQMPMVLVQLRWDGGFGTMGGKVDPNEALRRALAREAGEEADFWVPTNAELDALGTYQDGDWRVHSFAMEVTYDELVEARTKATRVSATSPECTGWCIVPTQDYLPDDDVPRGVTAFCLNNFRSTAKLEFEALLALIRSKL